MKKPIQLMAWIAFAIVAAGALIYGLSGNGADETMTASQSDPQPVTILKYSDYQCPGCKQVRPWEEQLKQEFGDLVTIEYRHFPLGGHPYANLAARAAEAARLQDQFEVMHDRIFEGQEIWSAGDAEAIFISYAEEIGLEVEQFRSDMHSEEVANIVQLQRNEGDRRMVRSTPTFFINGQMLRQNPANYQQFRSIVEMFMYR